MFKVKDGVRVGAVDVIDATGNVLTRAANAKLLLGKGIGTAGDAIPVLDGVNTWSGTQSFAQPLVRAGNVVYDAGNLQFGTGLTLANGVLTAAGGGAPGTAYFNRFVANAGQTAFTLGNNPANANSVIVTRNGLRLDPQGGEYTLSGSTLSVSVALQGDTIIAEQPAGGNVDGTVLAGKRFTPFSATGTGSANQVITLPASDLVATEVVVMIYGLHQRPTTDYTISGASLTILDPVQSGETIYIRPQLGAKGDPGAAGSGGGTPPGGVKQAVLTKNSATDGDTSWKLPLADFPVVYVTLGGFYVNSYNFTTIPFGSPSIDTHSGWDSANSAWVCPAGQAGLYRCIAKLRIKDGYAANISYGLGVHTTNTDQPDFEWSVTNGKREGHKSIRVMNVAAGDSLRAFYYMDGSIGECGGAVMIIERIR